MMGVEDLLRLTVAALMSRTGERQNDLADGLGLSQAQVSRKQAGRQHWSLEDVDRLAEHFGLHFLDLLAGPTHAVGVLHGATPALRPTDGSGPFDRRAADAGRPVPHRACGGRARPCGAGGAVRAVRAADQRRTRRIPAAPERRAVRGRCRRREPHPHPRRRLAPRPGCVAPERARRADRAAGAAGPARAVTRRASGASSCSCPGARGRGEAAEPAYIRLGRLDRSDQRPRPRCPGRTRR
ncbi:helix-turn-helix domain-containing protein [Streptomyces virginiae]|uniref:helix-turn-helix domain-containing protein n=1 Tax=Streptomyces virginiae TaxID=1961 RepID=UPI0036EF7569